MEHCMIDGKRCSKCCELVMIRKDGYGGPHSLSQWTRYASRNDVTAGHVIQCLVDVGWSITGAKEAANIFASFRVLKKRVAKKRFPDVFANDPRWFNASLHMVCKHLTSDGCGNYANRPFMCSGYPNYDMSMEDWVEERSTRPDLIHDNGYSKACTFYTIVHNKRKEIDPSYIIPVKEI